MRKNSSVLACLLVTGSLLSACGNNNNNGNAQGIREGKLHQQLLLRQRIKLLLQRMRPWMISLREK